MLCAAKKVPRSPLHFYLELFLPGTFPISAAYYLTKGSHDLYIVVHSLRAVLASGPSGIGPVPLCVASSAAVPHCVYCSGRSAGPAARNHHATSTCTQKR